MSGTRSGKVRATAVIRTIAVMAVAAGTFIGSSNAALANEDVRGNSTGGGWIVGKKLHLTDQEKSDIAAKHRLWDAYSDYLAGNASHRVYAAVERRTERALDIELSGRVPESQARGCHPPRQCPSTKTLLPVRHNSQNQNFTCGNTTGLMIARYDGPTRSRYNHVRLRERTMGGRAHMRTYVHDVTPWASKNFKRGLNRWMKGRSRGYYQQHRSPRPRRVKKALRYSIDHGHPFAASTLELAGSDHYNGHPEGSDIGHWLVVRGYDKNLRRINFLDPAAGSAALPTFDARKRFERNTKRFTRRYLQSHGIAA